MNTLTFKKEPTSITTYGDGRIVITRISDGNGVRMILDELKELTNKTWRGEER